MHRGEEGRGAPPPSPPSKSEPPPQFFLGTLALKSKKMIFRKNPGPGPP
jgi:hypothetical protein